MTGLTLESVMRRFHDVHSISQEAIETISLWVMHYKDKRSIDIIVEAWLESFKIAKKDEQRIALFYIMNDVVQRAKSKHMDVLIPAFQPAVLSAVTMGRSSSSVKHVMSRCIEIFGERQVFTEASVNAMKTMLLSEENGDGDESYVELDSDEVYRKIELFERGRQIVSRGLEVLRNGDFDCKALMKDRMRDRTVAAQLVMETQQVVSQITSFRHSVEEQKRKMLELIETLELAKRNFSHQLKDVTVVEDAYQKYFQGIREVHSDLLEMEKTGVYPGATPPRDAPSPTANDDIYATGVENAMQSFRSTGVRDNTETADMDLDDDSAPIDVGGTSPLSGNLPPPPAPPAVLEPHPPTFLSTATPQQPMTVLPQLSSNGNPILQQPLTSSSAVQPVFQNPPPYGISQPPLIPQQANTSTQPPPASQPSIFTATQQNLSVPPPILTQPPPNIQALLKSIPSLQTIQQATAAAAAAAAAGKNLSNDTPKPLQLPNTQNPPPQMNFPPPTVSQQRFSDVDERVPPSAAGTLSGYSATQPPASLPSAASNYHGQLPTSVPGPVPSFPAQQHVVPVPGAAPNYPTSQSASSIPGSTPLVAYIAAQTIQPNAGPTSGYQIHHHAQSVPSSTSAFSQQQPNEPVTNQIPVYVTQQTKPQQPTYAEEGPSNIDFKSPGPRGDIEKQNGDGYFGDGGRDGYHQKPPPQFHNRGSFPSHDRGRPQRGGDGFYGRGAGRDGGNRGDQWRKSNDFRGGRGFGGPRGNSENRGRGGFHGGGDNRGRGGGFRGRGGFQGGSGFQRGRGRGNWGRDDY